MMSKWDRLRRLEAISFEIANVLDSANVALTPETALALIILAYRSIKMLNPQLTHRDIKDIIITLIDDYATLGSKLEL